ncbi:uncharacterized protein LOC129778902 isoform X2 [Toxorhynchites rutilus septentrionalis]|uniref:uncharacterized protein LOC129778902 isoform X2 n=1 Tax=Toxorhynchites rutilus septentrionalis TaxID=329112 RepID=UPI002479DBA3|nr:uncharacterized protein LOC129778902 isoform X2 [Toxorhynchites rutilus septentrionalis]
MGLFGWIKKDINLHRRRASAPPLGSLNKSDSGDRDSAYVEALSNFNDWRARQRLAKIHECCPLESSNLRRIPAVIEEVEETEGVTTSDFSTEVDIKSDELKALNRKLEASKSPRYVRHRLDVGIPKKPRRSVDFHRNINRISESVECNLKNTNASERHSMPTVSFSVLPRKSRTRFTKPNNSIIYENEVEEFEQMHVKDSLGDSYVVQSPPSRFFKENSSPYSNTSIACRSNPAIVATSPKKQTNLYQKSSQGLTRSRNYKDKRAPPPPVPSSELPTILDDRSHILENGSDSPFAGSYRGYEVNSSSIYDERVISSRAYRGDMKVLNSSVQSAASEERRKSPSYQTIVNKHGELVDYALPFSDSADTHSELNSTKHAELIHDIKACEDVITENFQFLNSDLHPSAIVIDDSGSLITEPISVLKQRSQIVTDLDRSIQSQAKINVNQTQHDDEVELVINEPQDILLELDSLEKWSKSIQISDEILQKQFAEKDILEYFQRASSQLVICWPKELHYRVGTLRNSFVAPLEFSCGVFRNAPVTLRKYSLNVDRSLYCAEEACKKDFELLNQMKHFAVASLMAVCFDPSLNQATLILEPFDFTLFDYIHKMNKRLSLVHAITVVQQICSAVYYLQECGYIHSNISSGSILMRKHPYTVKLTSFELTTEASDAIRKEIEDRYGSTSSSRNSMTSSQNEELKKITAFSRLIKNDEQFLRDKYRKLSKEVSDSRKAQPGTMGDSGAYDCRASRYLPYCKEYREKFSLFYYVAPELLVPKSNFVFPAVSTDVYSLTLLLWEILNGYVPFVVYSRLELEKLHVSSDLQLPMFEKERCRRFQRLFETGLASLSERKLSVTDIIDTLDSVLLELRSDKSVLMNGFGEDYEEWQNISEVKKKNELNDIRKQNALEKTDKIYFQPSGTENTSKSSKESTINDAEISAPTQIKQQPKKPARKIIKTKPEQNQADESKTRKSPFNSTFNLSNSAIYQSIFDFNNKFLSPRSAKQGVYERTSTIKKQKKSSRSNKKAVKELFEPMSSSDGGETFCKLSSSGSSKTDLQDNEDDPPKSNEECADVIEPLDRMCKESPARMNINSEKTKFLREIIVNEDHAFDRSNEIIEQSETSKSCDSSPGTRRKGYRSKLCNSMRFATGDITLPDTPIARKNKIRKHAWLSDQKLMISDENTSTPVSPQGKRSCSLFNNLASRESSRHSPLNFNISSSMQEIKPQKVNISVNIIKSPTLGKQPKAYSEEFDKTCPAIADLDIDKVTSEVPIERTDSTNDVFEGTLWKKEKEICERSQLRNSTCNIIEDEANSSATVITAHLTSVRDAIRKIESSFENTGYNYSPVRKLDSSKKSSDGKKISEESVVVEEHLVIPTKFLELERTAELQPLAQDHNDSQPRESITRLDVVLANNTSKKKEQLMQQQLPQSQPQMVLPEATVFNPNSQLLMRRRASNASSVIQRTVFRESILSSSDLSGIDATDSGATPSGSSRKKKLTTRVTVNMRKISRRASDIGASPMSTRPSSLNLEDYPPVSGCLSPAGTAATAPQRQSCGSDLLKAIAKLRIVQNNEDKAAARSGGAAIIEDRAAVTERRSLCTPVKGVGTRTEKMVCCNCGSLMVPADSLNAGSRIGMSAAFSELNFPRESLSSMFEDNMGLVQHQRHQSIPGTPMSRQSVVIPNAKSIEDLYIDDDFGQGLQLGANMELVEFIDDFHYLDEFGYDIYTEEIYDTDEGNKQDKAGEENRENTPDEEQFLTKCADLNPTNMDTIGSMFSPRQPKLGIQQICYGQDETDSDEPKPDFI